MLCIRACFLRFEVLNLTEATDKKTEVFLGLATTHFWKNSLAVLIVTAVVVVLNLGNRTGRSEANFYRSTT